MNRFKPRYFDQLALVAVDVQNDFCPGGSLAVEAGDLVVPALNRVMAAMKQYPPSRSSRGYFEGYKEQNIIATRDWHPKATNHFKDWPVHCVAGTSGAEFHPGLELSEHYKKVSIISKGTRKDEAGYSGFDGKNELGIPLESILGNPERTLLMIGGLATDYCVRATVLDARKLGYDTYVIEDAIRGVDPKTTKSAVAEMQDAGAKLVTSSEIAAAFKGQL